MDGYDAERNDQDRNADEWEQHDNGVHVNCSEKECPKAGKVERFHGHDYRGLLVCGCEEIGA